MTKTTTTERKTAPDTARAASKKHRLEALIRRRRGATLATLMEELGWQAHTVRAVISRLKKDGAAVALDRSGKMPVYRITATSQG